jgi:hypothetical protein
MRPVGTPVPAGLIDFLNEPAHSRMTAGSGGCEAGGGCVLVAADLFGDKAPEWVLMQAKSRPWVSFPVVGRRGGAWVLLGHITGQRIDQDAADAIAAGRVRVGEAQWRDLLVGSTRLRVDPEQ